MCSLSCSASQSHLPGCESARCAVNALYSSLIGDQYVPGMGPEMAYQPGGENCALGQHDDRILPPIPTIGNLAGMSPVANLLKNGSAGSIMAETSRQPYTSQQSRSLQLPIMTNCKSPPSASPGGYPFCAPSQTGHSQANTSTPVPIYGIPISGSCQSMPPFHVRSQPMLQNWQQPPAVYGSSPVFPTLYGGSDSQVNISIHGAINQTPAIGDFYRQQHTRPQLQSHPFRDDGHPSSLSSLQEQLTPGALGSPFSIIKASSPGVSFLQQAPQSDLRDSTFAGTVGPVSAQSSGGPRQPRYTPENGEIFKVSLGKQLNRNTPLESSQGHQPIPRQPDDKDYGLFPERRPGKTCKNVTLRDNEDVNGISTTDRTKLHASNTSTRSSEKLVEHLLNTNPPLEMDLTERMNLPSGYPLPLGKETDGSFDSGGTTPQPGHFTATSSWKLMGAPAPKTKSSKARIEYQPYPEVNSTDGVRQRPTPGVPLPISTERLPELETAKRGRKRVTPTSKEASPSPANTSFGPLRVGLSEFSKGKQLEAPEDSPSSSSSMPNSAEGDTEVISIFYPTPKRPRVDKTRIGHDTLPSTPPSRGRFPLNEASSKNLVRRRPGPVLGNFEQIAHCVRTARMPSHLRPSRRQVPSQAVRQRQLTRGTINPSHANPHLRGFPDNNPYVNGQAGVLPINGCVQDQRLFAHQEWRQALIHSSGRSIGTEDSLLHGGAVLPCDNKKMHVLPCNNKETPAPQPTPSGVCLACRTVR